MRTSIQVLSPEEQAGVHERTLAILARTGVRVDTEQGRRHLAEAGAQVDRHSGVVRFPRDLVEAALQSAPKHFCLGARRAGWDLEMNRNKTTLLVDGEAMFTLDQETGKRRPGTFDDWLAATRLIDALDEVGSYWPMIESYKQGESLPETVRYWRQLFANFSKHVQETIGRADQATWLLEVLQVIFGDREEIRRRHPLSLLLCPQSPLIIEGPFTDAYLALAGWDIPVAIMPMPLMGATAPGSMIATIVSGNCEVLAMLCLLQAAAPGTPVIYAPALAVANPRTGLYSAGAIEQGLMSVAAIEMARYYGLPVAATGMGTDFHQPGIQAGYERAMNGLLPALARPDILVGPGLVGGAMILSLEQMLIDVEIFRIFNHAARGIVASESTWLENVIEKVGPGGNFLGEPTTRDNIYDGEWYLSQLGVHDAFESWRAAGKPTLLQEARQKVTEILAKHRPLPLDEAAEQELARIEDRASRAARSA